MSGNHPAAGQSSAPDDGQDVQNPNHGGTLSNRQQRADRIRALPPVLRFNNFSIETGLALTT